MFDPNTLPPINIKGLNYGDIEIVHDKYFNSFTLLNRGLQWMTFNQNNLIQAKEMYSQYDMAYGDVLLTGFGFGILPTWIASKPEVNSVTVIEVSQEVIDVFLLNNNLSDKINIIIEDASKYKTDKHYDCLFLDHYELQDGSWIFKDMVNLSQNIPNHKIFWSWSLEDKIARHSGNNNDIGKAYNYFKNYVLKINTIPELSIDKINEYINCYYGKN